MVRQISGYPVVILCGGVGSRLRPLTTTLPKPLIPLGGEPILSYIIDSLRAQQLKHLVFCVGYYSDLVINFVAEYCHKYNLTNIIIDSGLEADIVRRLSDAAEQCQRGFFFLYGDTIADVSLRAVLDCYENNNALAVISGYQMRSSFGLLTVDSAGKALTFQEKPLLPYWINIGYGFLGPESFALLHAAQNMETFLMQAQTSGRLYVYPHRGQHITFNTLAEKEDAENAIRQFNNR